MIVINEDDESVKLLTASDVIAIEPDVIPIIIFIPAKMRLVIIPKIDIFTICFSSNFYSIYGNKINYTFYFYLNININ